MDDLMLDEVPSSSSSSSQVGESSTSTNLERGTMTDDGDSGTPRPIAARLYGENTRSSSTSSNAPCGSADPESTSTRKPKKTYKEKQQIVARTTRMKKYRENVEIMEFKCEESGLEEVFGKFFEELLTDDACPANVYFRIVESLDGFFRDKTWESNCPKLLCQFLCEHILKTCQELNEQHEKSQSTDEWKAREIEIQVLLTLHVFVVTDEQKWLDESINKMRMIFISVGAEQLRNFLDIMGDGLATIYDELCITLPVDLLQYNSSLFKMTDTDDNVVVKRRNGAANRLEQMLLETSDNLGIGGVERASTRAAAAAAAPEAPTTRRSLKRKNSEVPKELLSPTRSTRAARSDYKQFFVEDTPDEKYYKRKSRKRIEEEEEEEDEEEPEEEPEDDEEEEVKVTYQRKKKRIVTIKEEIDEEVKQTPVAKLRANAASASGKRCSKRLSDLVKLSEERSQVPRKARENLNKILEKAKTPLRSSITRPTRKSVLFGTTPTSSPAMSASASGSSGSARKKNASRSSLASRFAQLDTTKKSPTEALEVDTSDGHDIPTPSSSTASDTTPNLRERSTRRKPARFRDEVHTNVKPEPEDPEFDAIEMSSPTTSPSKRASKSSTSSSTNPGAGGASKWSDRKLKKQLGLTREDLNRYRAAMLSAGERNKNNKNVKEINWENAQVNRAGRVKGAGASEDGTPIFGITRRNVRTMICHVLLNDNNPDTSFNWNKVKFDNLGEKPRTRHFQSLLQKPEAFMESLKQRYIEAKTSPLKRSRTSIGASASFSSVVTSTEELIASLSSQSTSSGGKRRMPSTSGPSPKKPRTSGQRPSLQTSASTSALPTRRRSDEYNEFGFESEAED
ncbi:hypothetical protein CAEBREN_12229 [Caenorhabditis brenneri]|uniref:Treslin STD domain-containing protein n=1 Tax=Caenorhabditis brenneri TaxID=135651 RepID=G0MIJ4_CAEBE|nr:hypothetical protein CAEBREN_12229 [Caenorhabditis brenneri]